MNVTLLLTKKELNTIQFNIISYKRLKKKTFKFFLNYIYRFCF